MAEPLPQDPSIDQWQYALAPNNLGYKVKLVSQLMYRDFLGRLEPYGLTPFHYLVLCCLWEEDGLSTSGIADKLKQLGATLTGVVDRMEDRCLVYRERDPGDRRIIRIWLTDEGRQLMNVLPAIGAQTIDKASVGIPRDQQDIFVGLLNQIIANLL